MNFPWSPGHGSPKKLEERLVQWLEQDARPKTLAGVPHVALKRSDVARNRYLPSLGKELLKRGLSGSGSESTQSVSSKTNVSSSSNSSIGSRARGTRSSNSNAHTDPYFQELLDLQMGRL
jgi:hypothetical protein